MDRFRLRALFVMLGVVVLLVAGAWLQQQPGSAAASLTDLTIDGIEVTQSMQDLNNSVPLVAGKRTFVRVYVRSSSGMHPTTATLKVNALGLEKFLLPIAPGGPFINVRTSYNRMLPTHAFLFELPLWVTLAGEATLTAEVNPGLRWHPHNPEESNYANNTLSMQVDFDPVPQLTMVVADQPYTFNNITFNARPLDHWKSVEWLGRVYPLSRVKAYFRTLPVMQAQREANDSPGSFDLIYPNCSSLNLYMANHRSAIFGSPFIPGDTVFLGIATDVIGFMRGCAPLGGMLTGAGYSRVASSPVGNDNWGWDYDQTYADWYGAHEVGHAFSRPHVDGGPGYIKDGCGGEAKAYTHNPDGRISPTLDYFDPAAIFGFDTLRLLEGDNPVLSPYWHDVMTYCDYQWMSQTTYKKLKEMFEAVLPLQADQAQAQEVLSVFGALDTFSGEIKMQPISVLLSEAGVNPPRPGPYAVVLRGPGGDELARYPFTPAKMDGGPAPQDGEEEEPAFISQLIPYQDGIARLEIEGPAGVQFQVAAGLSLPAVQLLYPNGGEVFGAEDITVMWNASEADGDPLTFNVDYSPDNGNSWEPVAYYITETQVTISQINLPASDMGLFRVSASDGIHTTRDTSDGVFFIPNHLPEGEIIAPGFESTIALEQTIAFQAQAYDYDLGTLDEDSLSWWSNLDGLLGSGAFLSTADLSEGLHEISLVANDGQGQYTLDQVVVIVVATPYDLPAQPDQLTAGPDLVFLFPASGVGSATIYLDNLNLGSQVAWQVTADAGWVILSAAAGLTPQEISVSTSLTALDFGTHKALLTFSDPQGLYAPVYIVVVVTVPQYNQYLPMQVRK